MQFTVEERRTFKIVEEEDELSVFTPHLGGGIISKEIIDKISEYPTQFKIQISGLNDETLDYFITTQGNHFRKIHFFKCPKISDFKSLEKLNLVEEVEFYWNQGASTLWNMSENYNLTSISLFDFRKQMDISLLGTSSSLRKFEMGSLVPHGKTSILSTKSLSRAVNLRELILGVDYIENNDYTEFAKLKSLESFHVSPSMYPLDVFAWLKGHLSKEASINLRGPTVRLEIPFEHHGKQIDTYVIGKGKKKWLNSEIDREKIQELNDEFESLMQNYRMDMSLTPKDSH